MASGMKKLVINSQERAVSADINRLQDFKGADVAEMMRYLLNVGVGDDDLDASAVTAEFITLGTPLRAEIMNGFLVKPQTGSLNLLVDAGVMYAIAPDAGADDSNYKYIKDAGVTSLGALAIANNVGGGAIRIDVIECQVNSNFIAETATRDVFDSTNAVYNATTVTKALLNKLNYRVRQGTPGAGFPASVSGWLPLCVASLPDAATTNDVITFWDVRPLLNDRVFGASNTSLAKPRLTMSEIYAFSPVSTTSGVVEAYMDTNGTARRIGGRLRSGSTDADAETIDLTSASNQEPSVTFTDLRPWYLYLATPFSLPRWARYTSSGTRVPRSPRGIPIVSVAKVPDPDGRPSTGLTLPALTGLGATTTTSAFCVAAGYNATGNTQCGFYTRSGTTLLHDAGAPEGNRPMQVTASTSGLNPCVATYTLTAGNHYPTHAREILCEFRADVDFPAAVSADVSRQFIQVFAPNGGGQITEMNVVNGVAFKANAPKVNNTIGTAYAYLWVPLPSVYPSTTAPTQVIKHVIDAQTDTNGFGTGGAHLRILGWKL